MSNDLTAFDPPLGPQPANSELYSPHIEPFHLSNTIFRSEAYSTILLRANTNTH